VERGRERERDESSAHIAYSEPRGGCIYAIKKGKRRYEKRIPRWRRVEGYRRIGRAREAEVEEPDEGVDEAEEEEEAEEVER